ncbi:hypothetical protein ACFFSY_29395 [Paenibacillus aurantiacus]|uniref:Uncharacterized protein n=1 Tax=Paenibacillus aurantiacus TaxID=1936118 RepID=A0ABV5L0S7_9BACL
MKKKSVVSFFLAVIVLLIAAVPAFAANSSSITVSTYQHAMTPLPVDGLGQYGKITLSGNGDASLYVYYNKGDGVWRQWTINDPGTGWLFLSSTGGSKYLDFYMNIGWQYKVEVFASNSTSATGTIRNTL